MFVYQIRSVGIAYGVYFNHPDMVEWVQQDVYPTLEEARQYIKDKREGKR